MSSWKKLCSLSFTNFSNILRFNDNEFIIVASDGIYKYKICNDDWTKMMDFGRNIGSIPHSTTYDRNNGLIYVLGRTGKLYQIDLNRKSLNKLATKNLWRSFSQIMFINDSINILGPAGHHFVFDKFCKTFRKQYKFDSVLCGHRILFMKLRKSMLLFDQRVPLFYEYTFNNKWNKCNGWNIAIPNHLMMAAITVSKNEQFIIMMGGFDLDHNGKETDNILVYDTKNNRLSLSSMRCPIKGVFRTIMTHNTERDNLLTFGYVNDCFKSEKFKFVQLLPHYMVQLIRCWISNEEVYLIGWESDQYGGHHWKINLDHILQTTE